MTTTQENETPPLTRDEILAAHIEAGIDVYDAVEVLARCRHQLPNDILRSLQSIWFCASAARFGQPYEPFWEDEDESAYAEHDVAECEGGYRVEEGATERATP